MSMTDTVADMLTRVRNANLIRSRTVDIPGSRLKKGIAEVLKREGFIADFLELPLESRSVLRLTLKYGPDGENVIREITRVSKPGRRVYSRATELTGPSQGQGIYVLSTDRGVISDREARERNAGGEVLCKIS
jgi:small subunit ribosomal protein S8